jgi:hypothetical protein
MLAQTGIFSIYPKKFFKEAEKNIYKYNLSYSYKKDTILFEMKREFEKTYSIKM